MRRKSLYRRITDLIGDAVSVVLSSMEMFYVVTFIVLVPLLFQHPNTLLGWVTYASTAFLQAVALPVLAYISKKEGSKQEKLLRETHDTVMREMKMLRQILEEVHPQPKEDSPTS